MAANLINQLSTANTFQHWLGTTTSLVGTTNLLTNGNGQSFFANTRLIIGGTAANVSLNVETGATINVLTTNTINVINVTVRDIVVSNSISSITTLNVVSDLSVFGNTTITGDLIVSGNITLDALGFDDLSVAGSGSFGNTLSVIGSTTLSNVQITGNVASINVTSQANFANNVRIHGDLIVSGNLTLDEVGFDDLSVAGSATIANTLSVTGNTTLINANVTQNLIANNLVVAGTSNTTGNARFVNTEVTGTLTAAFLTGNANTQIQTSLQAVEAVALAFSIALG